MYTPRKIIPLSYIYYVCYCVQQYPSLHLRWFVCDKKSPSLRIWVTFCGPKDGMARLLKCCKYTKSRLQRHGSSFNSIINFQCPWKVGLVKRVGHKIEGMDQEHGGLLKTPCLVQLVSMCNGSAITWGFDCWRWQDGFSFFDYTNSSIQFGRTYVVNRALGVLRTSEELARPSSWQLQCVGHKFGTYFALARRALSCGYLGSRAGIH